MFAASKVALRLRETSEDARISRFHSLVRPGSEVNRLPLRRFGIAVYHADVSNANDVADNSTGLALATQQL
jgi:hypothetical protein